MLKLAYRSRVLSAVEGSEAEHFEKLFLDAYPLKLRYNTLE